MNTENKLKPKFNWPDDIRRKMVEKSEFYTEPKVYQFGYYDGFQKAIEGCDVLPSELLKQRDELRKQIELYKECFAEFIPLDKYDEATLFLSSANNGLAIELAKKGI